MSDNPAGGTSTVSVGLVAAENNLGSTQTGQEPAVGARSTFDASGQNDIFQMAGDANPAVTPEGLSDACVGSSFDAAGNQIAAPEVSIEVGPTGTPAGSPGEVGADSVAPGSVDAAPVYGNLASGNVVASPANGTVPGDMSVDSNASAPSTDDGGSSDSSTVPADGDNATDAAPAGAAPADGDAVIVPPTGSDTASGGVNPVPSSGGDASGDAATPDGDNMAGDGSGDSDNEQVRGPVVPAHEAVLSQNPYGMFDVSLSFKAEYSSRALFGKTTTDYTKGGRITCKLSKWVQGSGLHGEPADFKYTKTDASGQTVAFDGAPEAVVSEDGTLVWTVGGLDPRDSATLEAGTTYTITFRVFARDLAYSDFAAADPEVPDHNYPVFSTATLEYLQMQEKTGMAGIGFDGLTDYNQVAMPVTRGPQAPSVGGDSDGSKPGQTPGDSAKPEVPGPSEDEPSTPAPETVKPAPSAPTSAIPKTADDSASVPVLMQVLAAGVALLVSGAALLFRRRRVQ